MYSIIDIETTGLSPKMAKITEIAVYVYDGEKVVDEMSTLLNPEIDIPYNIIQMTGINNRMVREAPRFCDIAGRLVEMTENTVLVGHNVGFDYNFIRKEFREYGYDYRREKICTAKLSRKLFPGRRSYSLGILCGELGIENPRRHRAYGDALATLRLFELLRRAEKNLLEMTMQGLNASIDRKKIGAIPEKPGVYYFYNDRGEIIYIGKSKNLRDRVMSHLTNNRSKRAIEMRDQIADIGYEPTGNELIALLLESEEIKTHQPLFNKALRRTALQWGLYSVKDENGYLHLEIMRNKRPEPPLTSFASKTAATSHLIMLAEAFTLCQKFCGLYESKGACFHYQIKQCKGACIGAEPPEVYNERVARAVEPYVLHHNSFLVIGEGRSLSEHSVVLVEHGKYKGFGYINYEVADNISVDMVKEAVSPYPDRRDSRQIIRNYVKGGNGSRLIPL